MSDPYLYPGTDILVNKEGIRDRDALEQFERIMTAQRISEGLPRVAISPDGLRTLHHHLFQDVYEWAGRDRSVDMSKGQSFFCRPEFIARELDARFHIIRGENDLKGLTSERFAERAAEHVSELNVVHPFREGNGRTLRAFLEVLGKRAGHHVDLTRIHPEGWHQASIHGFQRQDYAAMRELIAAASIASAR
jgi:cell filamentation protein